MLRKIHFLGGHLVVSICFYKPLVLLVWTKFFWYLSCRICLDRNFLWTSDKFYEGWNRKFALQEILTLLILLQSSYHTETYQVELHYVQHYWVLHWSFKSVNNVQHYWVLYWGYKSDNLSSCDSSEGMAFVKDKKIWSSETA